MSKLDVIKMRDPNYADWVETRKNNKFQMIPQMDPLELVRHEPAQVRGLVEGLWEMTHARVARLGLGAGYVFTPIDVVEWFDVAYPNKYVMTQMGAVRVFFYYLRVLKMAKVLKSVE